MAREKWIKANTGTLQLNNLNPGSKLVLDESTGNLTIANSRITLEAGYSYEVMGSVGISSSSSDADLTYYIYDVTNDQGVGSYGYATSDTTQPAEALVEAATETVLELVISDSNNVSSAKAYITASSYEYTITSSNTTDLTNKKWIKASTETYQVNNIAPGNYIQLDQYTGNLTLLSNLVTLIGGNTYEITATVNTSSNEPEFDITYYLYRTDTGEAVGNYGFTSQNEETPSFSYMELDSDVEIGLKIESAHNISALKGYLNIVSVIPYNATADETDDVYAHEVIYDPNPYPASANIDNAGSALDYLYTQIAESGTYRQPLDFSDWVFNGSEYEMTIAHNLDQTRDLFIQAYEGGNFVDLPKYEIVDNNNIKVFVGASPDARFSGEIVIKE